MPQEKPRSKALRISRVVIDASKSSEPQEIFGRTIDELTDGSDGEDVVREFVKLYRNRKAVWEAVNKVDRWIGIEHWVYRSDRNQSIAV